MKRREYVVMIDRDDDTETGLTFLEDARRMATELNEELDANGLDRTAYVAVYEYDEYGCHCVREVEVE